MSEREAALTGSITEGPTPDEYGDVLFQVRAGDETVIGVANACGVGWRGEITLENRAVVNATMATVGDFVEVHKQEMPSFYREAARLRRAKGNPPPAGNTRRGYFELVGQPTRVRNSVRFTVRSAWATVDVLIFREGGFVDHCDDWEAVSNLDRDEAVTIALDYIFAHPGWAQRRTVSNRSPSSVATCFQVAPSRRRCCPNATTAACTSRAYIFPRPGR